MCMKSGSAPGPGSPASMDASAVPDCEIPVDMEKPVLVCCSLTVGGYMTSCANYQHSAYSCANTSSLGSLLEIRFPEQREIPEVCQRSLRPE